jgi:hypothetical protein
MTNIQTTTDTLLLEQGITVLITHVHNEHGRKWDDENRDTLPCRANAADDRAAGLAAQTIDNRFKRILNHGKMMELATNGSIIHHDIKEVIQQRQTQVLLNAIRRSPQNIRIYVKQADKAIIDTEASQAAYKLLRGEAHHSAARARLCRDRASMPELRNTATRDPHDKSLSKILKKCGEHANQCPWCYDPTTRKGQTDSREHRRDHCTHQETATTRRRLHILNQERHAREGTPGHGAQVGPMKCDGHQRAAKALPETISEHMQDDPEDSDDDTSDGESITAAEESNDQSGDESDASDEDDDDSRDDDDDTDDDGTDEDADGDDDSEDDTDDDTQPKRPDHDEDEEGEPNTANENSMHTKRDHRRHEDEITTPPTREMQDDQPQEAPETHQIGQTTTDNQERPTGKYFKHADDNATPAKRAEISNNEKDTMKLSQSRLDTPNYMATATQ